MVYTIEEYRAAFREFVPDEERKAVVGRSWEKPDDSSIRVTAFDAEQLPNIRCCPIGVCMVEHILNETEVDYAALADVEAPFAWEVFVFYGLDRSDDGLYATINQFIRDWDDDAMTVEEMEAIFA